MSMTKIFIYSLSDPETLQVRYIGKTTNLQRRFRKHINNSKKRKYHSALWIRSLVIKGKEPILNLIEETDKSNWQQREIFWIEFYRNQTDLTNILAGGQETTTYGFKGKKHSLESIEKMKKARTGKTIKQMDRNGLRRKAIIAFCDRNKKSVYQFDLNRNFISKWDSAVDAAKALNLEHSNITRACKNSKLTCGKFHWSYNKE